MKIKAAFKIWVVIYPSITLFLFLFGKQLSALPLYLRTFALTALLVPWMVFVGLPLIEFIARALAASRKNENNMVS